MGKGCGCRLGEVVIADVVTVKLALDTGLVYGVESGSVIDGEAQVIHARGRVFRHRTRWEVVR